MKFEGVKDLWPITMKVDEKPLPLVSPNLLGEYIFLRTVYDIVNNGIWPGFILF